MFELVANLLRAADDRIMNAAAAAEVNKLPYRRVLVAAGAHDAIADRLQAGNIGHLLVRERLVHAFAGKIEVEGFRQQRQRVDLERQLLDARPFIFGLHPASRGNDVDQLRDLDVLRIAAAARNLRFEIGIVALADLDAWIDDEDQLAPLRPEALAATALAGLDDDGVPLR